MDPFLTGVSLQGQTLIAICFLGLLVEGHTLQGIRIREETLKGYMSAVAEYTSRFYVVGRDIRLEPQLYNPPALWVKHPLIGDIYNKPKRWQGVRNKKAPLTKNMINWLCTKIVDPDGFVGALVDWCILALATGYCGCE